MSPYIVRPAAAGDIRRTYQRYERAREGLGEELLVEVRVAIDEALRAPMAYQVSDLLTRLSIRVDRIVQE